ncbi:DUF3783 domain-containing protein [Clostridium sp. 'White wine YQ']|uniref:DUF3783 domain-containing protein n=1 Tax=Clostridium sp. 'White wine YQ' TaxID=3027474 RepID=UPI00236713C1|nr:DUF3783 domain-containing protein [Clostridium sp. 'White wine YQ']MDD7795137.1 DUF3783 domain-containing protein [Clostridium sp. 'White wine YQ']
MLNNQKTVLVYGFSQEQSSVLSSDKYDTVIVSKEMINMKLKDIIDGLRFETFESNPAKEQVVVFNNFTDDELKIMLSIIKGISPNAIKAVVTPTSINWSFKYLIEHLVEEREWYKANAKK